MCNFVGVLMFFGLLSPLAAEKNPSTAKTGNQSAIQQMAVIMHRLKHFPSPQSKETLQHIITSSSASEREKDLATAILNLNHRALLDDKIKLKKIMEDEDASADERDLASIIYHLDHRPTKGDKKRLQEMMQ
ncbi:hypothetical protein [Kaarinaea lacus]